MAILKLPIETETMVLRPFTPGDLGALKGYIGRAEAQRYIQQGMRTNTDAESVLQMLGNQVNLQRPGDVFTLAIFAKKHQQVVGQVSLRWSDATAGQGEISFVLHPHFTGQGYAQQAIAQMFDLAFNHYRIHRVFARCDGRNHHSAKLFETLGMRLEAHYREHALFQGEWDEEMHFAILDREWRQSSKVRPMPVRTRVA